MEDPPANTADEGKKLNRRQLLNFINDLRIVQKLEEPKKEKRKKQTNYMAREVDTPLGDWEVRSAKKRLFSTLQHFYTKVLKLKWDVSHIPRTYHRAYEEIKEELINGRWVVHNTHLTADTKVIESYLSRYFQRVRHYGLQAGSKYSIIRANGEVAYLYPLSKSPRTNIFEYHFNCSFFF